MSDDLRIAAASYEDLPEVTRIHVASWKQAYVGQVPQSYRPTSTWLRACTQGGTRATDRSRGSCPRAENAAEYRPDRSRMLPSE